MVVPLPRSHIRLRGRPGGSGRQGFVPVSDLNGELLGHLAKQKVCYMCET